MGMDLNICCKKIEQERRISFEITAEADPFDRIGKPEPLKYGLTGLWSRRISDIDRLTYKVVEDVIVILACKGQYE